MVLKEVIFNSFYIWEGVVVLKELIFNSFYIGGGLGTGFYIGRVVVLKELIFNGFYFGRVWWS